MQCVGGGTGSHLHSFYINVTPLCHNLNMLVGAVERAEAAVAEMLAIARSGAAATSEMRFGLERTKSIASMLSAVPGSGGRAIAAGELHGDTGAGVLRHATGVSRRQAESHVKTGETLETMPAVREAVETGRVSFANAGRLAQAGESAGVDAVQGDRDLMSKAESMDDDQFAREARRWIAHHRPDGGEADHERQRQRRSLRIWDGDDGMTHLKAELDPVTGERIRNRLEAEARRLYKADKKSAPTSGASRRTFRQCMADALDRTTEGSATEAGSGSGRGNAGHPLADIAIVAHLDEQASRIVAQLANGEPLPQQRLRATHVPVRHHPLALRIQRRAALARRHQEKRNRRTAPGAHQPRRRLQRMPRQPGVVRRPPRTTRLRRRADRHHQHDPALLGLPHQGPPSRLASPPPRRRPVQGRTAEAGPSWPCHSTRAATALHSAGATAAIAG